MTQFCVEEAILDAHDVRERHARLHENTAALAADPEPVSEHQRLGNEMAALMAKARAGEG